MNRNVIVSFVVGAVVLLGGGVWLMSASKSPVDDGRYDAFAQCLAEKKLTMYGASWCPHCQAEKARLGSSFKYVPYVECPNNPNLCVDKGVNGYPTWITAEGMKLEGEQGLEGLAKISGCQLPN